MPIYEYHCHACGRLFDKLVSLADADALPCCPHCESDETEKRLSTFAPRGGGCSATPGGSPFS